VFNYGEPEDDWLGLNLKRVNKPGKKLANNAVVGVLDLDLDASFGLKEKTNREGFFENPEFNTLRLIGESVLEHFNLVRLADRGRLDELFKKDPVKESSPGKVADESWYQNFGQWIKVVSQH
jgi:hypothetical protein